MMLALHVKTSAKHAHFKDNCREKLELTLNIYSSNR